MGFRHLNLLGGDQIAMPGIISRLGSDPAPRGARIGGLRPFPGGPERAPALKVTINVDPDATPVPLETPRAEVEARCPVSGNVANATPVNIVLSRI
jgi:hypothetical protein